MAPTSPVAEIHWVKSLVPTVLANREFLPVPPTDLIIQPIDGIYIFPGPLDVEKLKHALSQMLRDYPHVAGRLSYDCKTQQWRIILNNHGVPITLGSTQHPGIYAHNFYHARDPDFYETLPVADFPRLELVPTPLMKLKLTTWKKTGETSLTITACHVTGDGTTFVRMMNSLSNYYQGIPPPMIPTFEKYLRPEPVMKADFIEDAMQYLYFLAIDYDMQDYWKRFEEEASRISRVDLKLSSKQLRAIATLARKDTLIKISTMDAVAAYIISVIQRISDIPIRRIQHVSGFRGLETAHGSDYQPPPESSAGNAFMVVCCKEGLDGSQGSIGKIAGILRKSMLSLRQPETFRRAFALYAHIYDRASKTDRLPWEWPGETAVQVNTLTKLPFLSCHFGFPGRARYYFWYCQEHFLEIYPANPVQLPSGEWETYEGGVDIWFGLKHALKSEFFRVVDEDMKCMGIREKRCGSKM